MAIEMSRSEELESRGFVRLRSQGQYPRTTDDKEAWGKYCLNETSSLGKFTIAVDDKGHIWRAKGHLRLSASFVAALPFWRYRSREPAAGVHYEYEDGLERMVRSF